MDNPNTRITTMRRIIKKSAELLFQRISYCGVTKNRKPTLMALFLNMLYFYKTVYPLNKVFTTLHRLP